ncbi:MAG: hypothetical protein KatS3mg068_1027 [Candidatus Sericytochromatia bacterium]|nr:MAG: hypothetical protein KatS3mg068_1027 [Candidatus Sericytochromatia bacterium]
MFFLKYKNFYFLKLISFFVLLILISIFSLLYGYYDITFYDLKLFFFNKNISQEKLIIINEIRLPRLVLAFLCASILSVSGLLLQGIFKNSLVDPFVLGISGTASLGAGIGIILNKNLLGLKLYIFTIIFIFNIRTCFYI